MSGSRYKNLIGSLGLGVLLMVGSLVLNACVSEANNAGPWSVLKPPLTGTPTVTATPTPLYYEVQAGDALWLIAQRFGIELHILIAANELENPDLLQPGQRLLISDRMSVSGKVLPTRTPTPLPCLAGCRQPFPGCEIKGFVARLDGARVYLLPEDELYTWRSADMWFCREEDAQRNGWRRWTPQGLTSP